MCTHTCTPAFCRQVWVFHEWLSLSLHHNKKASTSPLSYPAPPLASPLLGLISEQQSNSALLRGKFLFQLLLLLKTQLYFGPNIPEICLLLCVRHLAPFSKQLLNCVIPQVLWSLASIVPSISTRRLFLDLRIHFSPFWKQKCVKYV